MPSSSVKPRSPHRFAQVAIVPCEEFTHFAEFTHLKLSLRIIVRIVGGQRMSMIDLIRNADSEANIYALLTSYIDALGHSDKGMLVAQSLLALPIYGATDLQARYSLLLAELDLASRRLDHQVCIVYKEALAILATALHCIRLLKYSMRNECFLS